MKYLILLILALPACSSQSSPSVRQRQDAALHDPMNYSPDTTQHNDITGGGTADLKKDSLKKDFNSVFNP